MGITIHYSGRLKAAEILPALIEEVKDIARANDWNYHIFEKQMTADKFGSEKYDNNIYGILFSPPGSEPVWFTFLSNGRMCMCTSLQFFGNSDKEQDKEFLYYLFTKTQFAGHVIHKKVINILKYISSKYLQDFKLTDEGKFWDTNDEEKLIETFKSNTFLIDSFASGLENSDKLPDETLEDYILSISKSVIGAQE